MSDHLILNKTYGSKRYTDAYGSIALDCSASRRCCNILVGFVRPNSEVLGGVKT